MSLERYRILVVEDRVEMRHIIKTILHGTGLKKILEAVDGREALRMLEQGLTGRAPIDLIICDWNMPNMTGIELLEEVRSHHRLMDLPFLMVTSENDTEHVTKALGSGVTDYVVKPFTAEMLTTKMMSLLRSYR